MIQREREEGCPNIRPEVRRRTGEPRPGVYSERDSDREGALDETRVEPHTLRFVGTNDAHVEEHVVDVWEKLREADRVD